MKYLVTFFGMLYIIYCSIAIILGNLTQQVQGYSLSFAGSNTNAIMRMAYQVVCEGLFITRLEIVASDESGTSFAGTMEITGVD